MKPWFEVGDDNSGWSAQKVTNLHLMLQVTQNTHVELLIKSPNYQFIMLISTVNKALHIFCFWSQLVRVMVSPVNPPGATASCQKSMYLCGLLQQLCTILMATGVPADILTEVIMIKNPVQRTVVSSCLVTFKTTEFNLVIWLLSFRPSILYQRLSEAHRSTRTTLLLSMHLQTHQGRDTANWVRSVSLLLTGMFSELSSSSLPRPAIVVLLMSMVNERQPFVLRCAVLYCFQCFLYKNQKGQGEIVATLLPSTIDGQLHKV